MKTTAEMKKYILANAVLALIMCGCADQQILDEEKSGTYESAQLRGSEIGGDSALISCKDPALEAAVSNQLQNKMAEYDCSKGVVYVVETATGAIKAHVSLANRRKQFVPCEDTYNNEQSAMMMGPTYLALLASGKLSPEDVIDAEGGVYKNVRDHNWRRGGYGPLTLEQAFSLRSQVVFTKAAERVYGDHPAPLDSKVTAYLANMPDNAMGMLTFYNAVANGGRMVRLVKEGKDVIVLNERIADANHIETLKKGLHSAVSSGMFKRAGRSYTTVAACGRTLQLKDNDRRMELCGYFPADKPIYTIMVILEKKGAPGSSSTMCAPIMACTIDLLKVIINNTQ